VMLITLNFVGMERGWLAAGVWARGVWGGGGGGGGFITGNHRPQGLSIAYLYRFFPVPVNIQLNVESEVVNREEAI